MTSHLCDHDQADEEATHTDDEEEDFTPMANQEQRGIHVWDGCHQCLQTYKLKERWWGSVETLFFEILATHSQFHIH